MVRKDLVASVNLKGSLLAGVLAAIGASVCCVGPLVLLALGVGGAWVSNLTALEPARPLFIAATFICLATTNAGFPSTARN